MADFFLDIVSEDLPPTAQRAIKEPMEKFWQKALSREGLYQQKEKGKQETEITVYTTPRRVAVFIRHLPITGGKLLRHKKGPWQDAEARIVEGFLKANKTTLAKCQTITENNRQRLAVTQKISATELLKEIILRVFKEVPLAESLKLRDSQGKTEGSWIRPLKTITALLDKKAIRGLENRLGCDEKIKAAETLAHPVLPPTEIEVFPHPIFSHSRLVKLTDALDAVEDLKKARVILDYGKRVENLSTLTYIDRAEYSSILKGETDSPYKKKLKIGDRVKKISTLVGINRTEYPSILKGDIDSLYKKKLNIEIIRSALAFQEARLARKDSGFGFQITVDRETEDKKGNGEKKNKIKRGYENVVRAKLADALFFIQRDTQQPLEKFLPTLKNQIYHQSLGTDYARAERIEALARFTAEQLTASKKTQDLAAEAGKLLLADLATEAVKEFPSMQQTIGGFYLAKEGKPIIGKAIAKDKFTGWEFENISLDRDLKTKVEAAVRVSLRYASSCDSLAGLWLCGERPTGSKDPYKMGVEVHKLFSALTASVDGKKHPDLLPKVLTKALELNQKAFESHTNKPPPPYSEKELMEFIKQRGSKENLVSLDPRAIKMAEVHSYERNRDNYLFWFVRYSAELAFYEISGDNKKGFEQIVEASTRVENILREYLNNRPPEINEKLLKDPAEKELRDTLRETEEEITDAHSKWQFAINPLTQLTKPLDKFFTEVKVKDSDPALANNRIALLFRVRECYRQVADFPKYRTG